MTDYNGKTFANIRKISFITDEEYLKSIGGKDFELHLGMGKGSNFFMKTHDNKYIIKSISKEESDECRIFIEDFCQYFEKNLNTLILPIFGSHKIDFSFKELNLIVMENLFVNKPDESYDLKGSSGLSNYF
jgi:1-phosphatidylinositol-4-phosphate 5-kinase